MKHLFGCLKKYRLVSILAPLFKLFEATLELFVPLVVANIIDKGIVSSDRSGIFASCALLVALGVVGLCFSVVAQYFSARAAVGSVSMLRSILFERIQSLSYAELDAVGQSTLITRLTADANKVQNGVNMTLRLLLRSPFVVFGAMIMAFTVDVKSALVFVVLIPVLSAVVFGIMLTCLPLYKKVQKGLDGLTTLTRENLTGVRVIRAFRRENAETEDFVVSNRALSSLQRFVGRVSGLMGPLTYAVVSAGIIALLYSGAVRIDSGELTQGQIVALYSYMSQILVELVKLASLIITITGAVASQKRIEAVFEDSKTGQTGADTSELNNSASADTETRAEGNDTVVEFIGAGLTYPGNNAPAVTGVELSVKRGETVGIIGGTGSGKTSLVNLIPRFYDAAEGAVRVFGRDVRDWDPKELRSRIGVVPQKAELFAGTVRDNLLFADENACDDELVRALKTAQAYDFIFEKGGLDHVLEQNGRNLSGGQKQRLTVARALVGAPEILILDDSASALDYATDAAMRSAIAADAHADAVFIVSQRAAGVMNADTILVLDGGAVVGCGKHDELLESCAVYREIYDSQFGSEEACDE
ncbi:MAG: ABC transporter ATP-binding protein/permease [Clostridia bacterium]|nr:ABC transporter ATP-binding protein/permease [Clostridia bacterium]